MNQKIIDAKAEVVKEVSEKAKQAASITVVEYHGLTVAQITELRRSLKEVDAEMTVYKNSLVERAVDELGYKELNSALQGPNAYVFSKDAIGGIKVIAKAAKLNEHLVIKGGVIDGKVMSAQDMKTIATLPGRDGLISMFLSCLQAPVRKFACAVKAIADKQN